MRNAAFMPASPADCQSNCSAAPSCRRTRLGSESHRRGYLYTERGRFAISDALMPSDDILLEAEEKMMKSAEVVQRDFASVRTSKASPALVENIQAEVYGSLMRVRELASITTPEPRM